MPEGEKPRIPIRLGKHHSRLPYIWNEGSNSPSNQKSFSGSRQSHGKKLLDELRAAERETEDNIISTLGDDYLAEKGLILVFTIDLGFAKKLGTFDSIQSGVELLNVKQYEISEGNFIAEATVFVAHGSLKYFVKRLENYSKEERNTPFVDPIQEIGLATLENLWTVDKSLPMTEKPLWWELWIRRGKTEDSQKTNTDVVRRECAQLGFKVQKTELQLPEHTVLLMEAMPKSLATAFGILNCLAEVREPVRASLASVSSDSAEQLTILPPSSPASDAPSVCVLDTGVNRSHPLLEPLCPNDACDTWDKDWTAADNDGHGTEMCGMAAFGDLRPFTQGSSFPNSTHWIESVKLLNDPNDRDHEPENYGAVTIECMAIIEQKQTNRPNRVFAMAITSEEALDFPQLAPDGLPTSWSSAIDKAVVSYLDPSMPRRLFVVSGGNSFPDKKNPYPKINFAQSFQDPAHSWNAVSVGANTHYVDPSQRCAARKGGLSPYSRTTLKWEENGGSDCPLKPEVVFEGGNSYADPALLSENLRPLSLEKQFLSDGYFIPTGATSAATAGIARLAAQIHQVLPDLWAETVRGLLVNSARWNETMLHKVNLNNKGEVHDLVRTVGYGEPKLNRAISGSEKRATFYFEEEIQPFFKPEGSSDIKTKEMIFFPLPMPGDFLEAMGDAKIKLHVTLSYFIEPNPGRRGLARSKFRYANCGLRFDLKSATESIDTFIANQSRKVHEKLARKQKGDRGNPSKGWIVGTNNQNRGSLHHDIWQGKAVDLASRDSLVIYPVDGWWRLRPKLERWDSKQRFALVVTIETEDSERDIYTAIEQIIPSLSVPTRVSEIEQMFETEIDVSIES